MIKLFLVMGCVFGMSSVHAAEKTLLRCNGASSKFDTLYIELSEKDDGKLSARYTFGRDPLYQTPWANPSAVVTPPARFPEILAELNRFRPTGIDPTQVKLFQSIFIDGTGRWDIEIWKLMASDGSLLGWMAWAYGSAIGCY